MIRIKEGASFKTIRPEIYDILASLDRIFKNYGHDCWITCKEDGHGPDDPHTNGFALDIRSKELKDTDKETVRWELADSFGDNYTVLFEAKGTTNEHFHIQIRKDLWRHLMEEKRTL